MKKLLLTAAVLGLVGTAWAQPMTLQQQMEENAKAVDATCDPGECKKGFSIPKEELDRISSAENQRNELHLRQMGVSPSTAKKAIWGASHFISSSCAFYVHELLGEYGLAEHGHYDQDDIEGLVIKIENSGVCEKKNLR